jgi:hypothetical protein
MSWATVLVLAASLTAIACFALIAWVKDRFDEMDRDRP